MITTPRTDATYAKVWTPANEAEATEALATMRDLCRELERENAGMRAALECIETMHDPDAAKIARHGLKR